VVVIADELHTQRAPVEYLHSRAAHWVLTEGQPAQPAPAAGGGCRGGRSRSPTETPDAGMAAGRSAPSKPSRSPQGSCSRTPSKPSSSPAGPGR
jgi:hypothetical protein